MACLAKAVTAIGVDLADDESEWFGFRVDCWGWMDTPLPSNYFCNCLAFIKAETTDRKLKENEGFWDNSENGGHRAAPASQCC